MCLLARLQEVLQEVDEELRALRHPMVLELARQFAGHLGNMNQATAAELRELCRLRARHALDAEDGDADAQVLQLLLGESIDAPQVEEEQEEAGITEVVSLAERGEAGGGHRRR